jgi:hypothetical protein
MLGKKVLADKLVLLQEHQVLGILGHFTFAVAVPLRARVVVSIFLLVTGIQRKVVMFLLTLGYPRLMKEREVAM